MKLLSTMIVALSLFSANGSATMLEQAKAKVQSPAQAVQAKANERVNINSASEQELASLPGIGAKKAAAIVAYRQQNGNFSTIQDLRNVKGIGKASMKVLEEKITI